jgi:hypothetical protein
VSFGEVQTLCDRLLLSKQIQHLKEGYDTLLNPEDGVIVKVNKVSEWRENKEKKAEEYEKALQDVRDLVQWKNGATKAMWIIFTAILGLSLNVFLL